MAGEGLACRGERLGFKRFLFEHALGNAPGFTLNLGWMHPQGEVQNTTSKTTRASISKPRNMTHAASGELQQNLNGYRHQSMTATTSCKDEGLDGWACSDLVTAELELRKGFGKHSCGRSHSFESSVSS